MKTLPQLLNEHNINSTEQRLEFEEIVNEVTRQHGVDLVNARADYDARLSVIQSQADDTLADLTKERDALQAELADLREKTSTAVKTASEAINDTALDDKATLAVLAAVISDVTKDSRQRQREALEASIAAQQAQLAAL